MDVYVHDHPVYSFCVYLKINFKSSNNCLFSTIKSKYIKKKDLKSDLSLSGYYKLYHLECTVHSCINILLTTIKPNNALKPCDPSLLNVTLRMYMFLPVTWL